MDLSTLTIAEARRALDAKEYSALELTNAYLEAIRMKDVDIHAYLEVWEESAREEAAVADDMIARGVSRTLTGIPIAVKDNILINGRTVSGGSKILEHYKASYDSTVAKKLKEQGAVLLGRTNMDEFALGSSTENSAYGPTKNPHDTSRVPGGTSGGSAAAVAAGMALGALGSDTGGSIRQPAALCGVVGMKPTYGAVSRFGLIAAASSLDQIGPIAKTISDAEMIFNAIQGHDANDSTSLPDASPSEMAPKKKVGVPRAFLKDLNAEMKGLFDATLSKLTQAGYELVDVDLPSLEYALAVYYIINPAEVSTNLSRFDGIRYGHSVQAESIGDVYIKSRGEGFGPESRRRIIVGTFVLSAGYSDAYYRKARALRGTIRDDFSRSFETVDAIVLPTTPSPAFKLGEKNNDPVSLYLEDIFTVPVNLAGLPALSQPMGTVVRDGVNLPTGFQIIAAHGREDVLFAIGKDIESK